MGWWNWEVRLDEEFGDFTNFVEICGFCDVFGLLLRLLVWFEGEIEFDRGCCWLWWVPGGS